VVFSIVWSCGGLVGSSSYLEEFMTKQERLSLVSRIVEVEEIERAK